MELIIANAVSVFYVEIEMTLSKLKQYRTIKAEISVIESRIKDCILKSTAPDGQPRGGNISKPTEQSAMKLAELHAQYDARLGALYDMEKEITQWVYSLDDYTVQAYVIMKYIEGRSNADIEETLFYNRTSLARKLSAVLED